MDAKKVVKEILRRQGKSQRSLAKDLGIPAQTLYNRLNNSKEVGMGTYVEMLGALGYELKVVPQEDTRPDFTLSAEDGAGEEGEA